MKLPKSDLKEHVLKTTHFVNSHFADTVDQSEQSIVTVDQSELSIESAKCEFTKCVVFRTCFKGSAKLPVADFEYIAENNYLATSS